MLPGASGRALNCHSQRHRIQPDSQDLQVRECIHAGWVGRMLTGDAGGLGYQLDPEEIGIDLV